MTYRWVTGMAQKRVIGMTHRWVFSNIGRRGADDREFQSPFNGEYRADPSPPKKKNGVREGSETTPEVRTDRSRPILVRNGPISSHFGRNLGKWQNPAWGMCTGFTGDTCCMFTGDTCCMFTGDTCCVFTGDTCCVFTGDTCCVFNPQSLAHPTKPPSPH